MSAKQQREVKRGYFRQPLRGGKGWRLRNPKGDREIKAALVTRFKSVGGAFAVFRIAG